MAGCGVLWQQLCLPCPSPTGRARLGKGCVVDFNKQQQRSRPRNRVRRIWGGLKFTVQKPLWAPFCRCNAPYTAIFVYLVSQSVSPQSERIPPKCSFSCACGWQEGQAKAVFYVLYFLWSCCLWLLSTALEELVSKKSCCLCVPQSGDCFHRNWSVVDGGGRRRKVMTSSPKRRGCQAKPQT